MEKKQFLHFLIPHSPDVEMKLQMPHCFVSLRAKEILSCPSQHHFSYDTMLREPSAV